MDQELKLRRNQNLEKAYVIGLILCTLSVLAYHFFSLRQTMLCCHDSMQDFTISRMNTLPYLLQRNISFCLARGKAALLFPLVVTLRNLILKTANYPLIWLMQYIPVLTNVVLLSLLIGKKAGKVLGLLFSFLFLCFLQIDNWHSLIICYPLDFMYGLSLSILSLWLFSDYLDARSRFCKDKKNLVRLVLSVFLYYESLQVYESFILASTLFFILTIFYIQKDLRSEKFLTRFACLVKTLLPHFIASIVYLTIYALLRIFPVTDIAVIAVEGKGTLSAFAKTWFGFSTNMFPLHEYFDNNFHTIDPLSFLTGKKVLIATVVAGLGGAFLAFATFSFGRRKTRDERRTIMRTLAVIGLCGFVFASLFAVPHAMTENYQQWYVVGAKGYVPSTICYFGWAIFCAAAFAEVLLFFSSKNRVFRYILVLLTAVIFGVGFFLTSISNQIFSDTYVQESIKAQNLFAMTMDEDFSKRRYDLIFTSSYIGLHFKIDSNEAYMESEIGYDFNLTNDSNEFSGELTDMDDEGMNPAVFVNINRAELGILMPLDADSSQKAFTESSTTDELYLISSHGGDFVISYTTAAGSSETLSVSLEPGISEAYPVNSALISSVNALLG